MDTQAIRTTPDSGQVIDTGRVPVWYHDDGEAGDPIFLLGGFTAGHFVFDFVRPHLRGYRTLTWEPRGLGRSACPDPRAEPYSVEIWADDLHALFGAIGIERAHIWACGFGSYIALRFAATYPDAVGALLTYTDVWAGDPAKNYAKIWDVYSTIIRNFGTSGYGARVLANIFDVSDTPWFGAWEAGNIEEVLHPETVEATVGYGLLHADVRDDLARVTAPTLVIQGDHPWDGSRVARTDDPSLGLMRDRIAQLEVANIPDAHPGYVFIQKPAECAVAAEGFLSRHPLRGSPAALDSGPVATEPTARGSPCALRSTRVSPKPIDEHSGDQNDACDDVLPEVRKATEI